MVAIVGFPLTNKKLTATYAKLDAEIATSSRCNSSSQCALVETGNDPCGGSSGRIAYSTTNAKTVHKIKRLAHQTRCIQENLNQEFRQKNKSPVPCTEYMSMKAACINRKCVAAPYHQTIPYIT